MAFKRCDNRATNMVACSNHENHLGQHSAVYVHPDGCATLMEWKAGEPAMPQGWNGEPLALVHQEHPHYIKRADQVTQKVREE